MDFIPVSEPLLGNAERRYLMQCLDDGWISSEGPFVSEFEEEMAARVGREFGIAVSSGSAALEVSLAALGVGEGDEVIMPTLTIISVAAPVVRAGGIPVVIDSDPLTWNMDVNGLSGRFTDRTKAIVAAHLYGLPIDLDPLLELAEQRGVPVIEDAAEMHGQTYRGKPCGSFGDLSVFSFYPNKLITTGEGGMIVTDDAELAESCRRFRNLFFGSGRDRFVHEGLGWNYRMTNLQAALGLAQLPQLDGFVERKRQMGARYGELLAGTIGLSLPPTHTDYAESVFWIYGLVLDDSVAFDATQAMEYLAARRVGTRPFFFPIHEQPVLRRMGLFDGEAYPVAERLSRRGFYIPSGLTLTDEQMMTVAAEVKELLPSN